MSLKQITLFASVALALCVPGQLSAHHAFGAEFDPNRPLILRGPVTKVEWVNPHAWIHLEITNDDGSKESWAVEGGTPNTLLRRGINKNSLVPGTLIIVDGYQSKDRSIGQMVVTSRLPMVARYLWAHPVPARQRMVVIQKSVKVIDALSLLSYCCPFVGWLYPA